MEDGFARAVGDGSRRKQGNSEWAVDHMNTYNAMYCYGNRIREDTLEEFHMNLVRNVAEMVCKGMLELEHVGGLGVTVEEVEEQLAKRPATE